MATAEDKPVRYTFDVPDPAAFLKAVEEMQQRAAAMGADAIVGVDIDYEVLGQGDMLMVTASGTAVTVAKA